METKTGFDSKLTNKTASSLTAKERAGLSWDTQRSGKKIWQQSPRVKYVSFRWACRVYMCVWSWWVAGEGLLQIQEEDIQSAFQVSRGGVHPYMHQYPGGINSLSPPPPPFIAGNTSRRVWFWQCNLNSESRAKHTSCSPKMFGEGREILASPAHTRQTNKALCCRMTKKYRRSPRTLVNDWCCQKTWQVGQVGWRNKGQFLTYLIYKKKQAL